MGCSCGNVSNVESLGIVSRKYRDSSNNMMITMKYLGIKDRDTNSFAFYLTPGG